MPRPKRADEGGGIYHALNRGNARREIFRQEDDYAAFGRIRAEGLERYPCRILSYPLMPNHWHFLWRPTEDSALSDFLRWVTLTHAMWYHAHYRIGGEGHLCQGRSKSFPIQDDDHFLVVCRYVERNALRAGLVQRAEQWPWGSLWRWLQQPEPQLVLLTTWPMARLPNWVPRVNASQSERELTAARRCIARGSPSGSDDWIVAIVQRLGLESTLRPRGRPTKTEKES